MKGKFEQLSALKTVQLKEELRAHGLSIKGKKHELIARLMEHGMESEEDDELLKLQRELEILEIKEKIRKLKHSTGEKEDASMNKTGIAVGARVPEPPVFNGDPLQFLRWRQSFQAYVDTLPVEIRIFHLSKYVCPDVLQCIEGYLLIGTQEAYHTAMQVLEKRYGDNLLIGDAFRTKLDMWPKISKSDPLALRKFSDFITQCVLARKTIPGLSILDDATELRRILALLPERLAEKWSYISNEYKREHHSYPPLQKFSDFLTTEADTANDPLTSMTAVKKEFARSKANFQHGRTATSHNTVNSRQESVRTETFCYYCNLTSHSTANCRKFSKLLHHEKELKVKALGLCFGCLLKGHTSKTCKRRETCIHCEGSHPSSMHQPKKPDASKPMTEEVKQQCNEFAQAHVIRTSDANGMTREATPVFSLSSSTTTKEMTTMILPVYVSTHDSAEILTYALVDSQSDTSYISEDLARRISEGEKTTLIISTLTSQFKRIHTLKHRNLTLRGMNSAKRINLREAFEREIPACRDHIPTTETAQRWNHLQHLAPKIPPLLKCSIGMLIGYDCSDALAPRQMVTGERGQPFAILTDLGWSIVGGSCVPEPNTAMAITHRIKAREISTDEVLKVLEGDLHVADPSSGDISLSQDERLFINLMERKTKYEAGRYSLPLPFKEEPTPTDSRTYALSRLQQIKRKLDKDPGYSMKYASFMEDLLESGEAERVPDAEVNNTKCWYIPHHGVVHPSKPQKIRVVFDCSATVKGKSLNDYLLSGPDLNNNLIGVLCRFRKEVVAFSCDIQKMYHQFKVAKNDRDYLRFLWYDASGAVADYRMTVHVFGARSSPSCATYGFQRLARDHAEQFKDAAEFVQHNFYVDDGLASCKSISEAVQLISQTRKLCALGSLQMHKIMCNHAEVMERCLSSEGTDGNKEACSMTMETKHIQVSTDCKDEPKIKTLGIQWNIKADTFGFGGQIKPLSNTRRGALATVASLFDPLGLVVPFTLRGRILLQDLCRTRKTWDEQLPPESQDHWNCWKEDFKKLQDVSINRCFKLPGMKELVSTELHIFCDASSVGYGACAYLRLVDVDGLQHSTLVMAKARVAPLKTVSIPRLELQAAVLGAKLGRFLSQQLSYERLELTFWTDSKITLGYINNDSKKFHVFVANRVEQIRQISHPEDWNYIPSEQNPADLASRGCGVETLMTSFWFHGPDFLRCHSRIPPKISDFVGYISPDDPEVKICMSTLARLETTMLDRFSRFSSWTRAVHIAALLKRNARKYSSMMTPELSKVDELRDAELWLLRMEQEQWFAEELALLDNRKSAKSIRLQALMPFLDDDGMLRVGGRLTHCRLSYDIKHPLILPAKGVMTKLLVRHIHQSIGHSGRSSTLCHLRQCGYHILAGSKMVASLIHKCIQCRKIRGRAQKQLMADLPLQRTLESPPFSYTGFDCFGPFTVKEQRKEIKRYGLIFTCLASRAVHIELLSDMTTNSFINGLRRFIALRGPISHLYSDQGSNFIGAATEFTKAMGELDPKDLEQFLAKQQCVFHFNSPSSSHMGGCWERMIRTARDILKGLLLEQPGRLDSEGLQTLFYEVMAIINSRPLSHQANDAAQDLEPLTPNHLLTMKAGALPPPGKFEQADVYSRKQWRRIQGMAQQFWNRWRKGYLLQLQERQKWTQKQPNVAVGSIVLLKDDNQLRNTWRLGRVVSTHPSVDGLVRKIKIQLPRTLDDQGKATQSAMELERPINKVIVLIDAEGTG